MKRIHVDALATAVLVSAELLLEHTLVDRDVVETLLSPNAGSSVFALLLAAAFMMTRVSVYVVVPAYWCYRGIYRAIGPRNTAPDRQAGPPART